MDEKQTHGGRRKGAGRKPKYDSRMEQKTIRLPADLITKLIAEFGSLQSSVEHLASKHLSV